MGQKAMNEPRAVEQKSYRVPTGAHTPLATKAAVIAMDSLGASQTKIAQELEISRQTVAALLKNGDHTSPAIVERIKREMEGRFWVTAARATDAITDEKLQAASALQLGTLAAIGTDKALLLSGKPTVRIEHTSVEDQEAAAKIEALTAELESWKDGTTLNAEMVGDMGGTGDAPPTE
jgi:plasmid maintenance system antidote protein VapI